MNIGNKAQMYELYRKGEFGNSLRIWPTWEAMQRDGYATYAPDSPKVGLRVSAGTTRRFRTEMTLVEAEIECDAWVEQGIDPKHIVWCESASHGWNLMNGQVQRSHEGLCLTYSTKVGITQQQAVWSLPEAEAERKHTTGFRAVWLLHCYMDSPSIENLERLLDTYDGAVVEFTIFDRLVGPLSWNTVFWEVRNY